MRYPRYHTVYKESATLHIMNSCHPLRLLVYITHGLRRLINFQCNLCNYINQSIIIVFAQLSSTHSCV